MTTADFFYIVTSLSFLILIATGIFVAIHVVQTLKAVRSVLEKVDNAASDLSQVKNGIVYAVLNLISYAVGKKKKGGD